MSTKIPVKLYYDIISPYTYFGFELISRYQPLWKKMDLQLKPVHLFAIIQATKNPPIIENEFKKRNLLNDLQILPQFYQIPLQFPSNFTSIAMSKQVIPPQRFLVAINQLTSVDGDQSILHRLTKAMYEEMFSTSNELEPLSSNERLSEVAKRIGLDDQLVKEALQKMNTDEVKGELRANVAEAVEEGAFGTPTFVIEKANESKRMVFGSDRMEIIAYLLGEKYFGPNP